MPRRRRTKKIPTELFEVTIDRISHDGRGIATINDKTTFIDNALPGEKVQVRLSYCSSRFNEAYAETILEASSERVEPKCEYFSICGGCSLQHLAPEYQRTIKEKTLVEQFQHFGKTEIPEILPPLYVNEWGYRRKARLGVRYVSKKEKVLVGFREKKSNFITDMDYCEVLHPSAAKLIAPLKALILTMDSYNQIPQIEVAVDQTYVALVVRHMQDLSEADQTKLLDFAKTHDIYLYLQPDGLDSVHLVYPDIESAYLHYDFPAYGIKQAFLPSDFAQVNLELNYKMIERAITLLALEENDVVLDLFCGFGNFTLPIAQQAKKVVGVEGSQSSIDRAQYNATLNKISNVEFHCANLFEPFDSAKWLKENYNKLLIYPPRNGAEYCVSHIEQLSPERIVYISCNPATLARDTGILLEKGYELLQAGIMDMFSHTNHVESIAVFNKK